MDMSKSRGGFMKKLNLKLNNNKGETIVEVIASILICVISVTLLMSGVAVSAKINKNADENDENFYKELSFAETKQAPLPIPSAKVLIKENFLTTEVPINLYGGEGIYSYEIFE